MGLIVWSLSLSGGLRDEMRSPCFFGVTSKGDHLPIPRGIQVPVFSFTPTSPPAVRASPLRGCGLIPPACAHSSAPFVSIHTLLELGAQYTFVKWKRCRGRRFALQRVKIPVAGYCTIVGNS